jgi:hypothetical protein
VGELLHSVVSNIRQIETHTAEPLVPDPPPFYVEIAVEKLESYQSPGNDHIPVQEFQTRADILQSEIHKLVNSVLNKEELPGQWKDFIVTQIYKKDDKTDCSNYRGISLFSTLYKILSNILLSALSPYVDEAIEVHQRGFQPNRSTTDRFLCFVLHSSDAEEEMGV